MAQQEEGGWPLGLRPLNMRPRDDYDFSGSISCNTLLSGSPALTSDSSSDVDTQSTGSFFHDKSITLGNLLGVASIVELSRRSLRSRRTSETITLGNTERSNLKSKLWCFSFCLCRKDIDVDIARNNTVPLGRLLEVERRVAQEHRRGHEHGPLIYGPDELALAQPFGELSNSLFVDGRIVPPTQSSPCLGLDSNGRNEGRRLRPPCF